MKKIILITLTISILLCMTVFTNAKDIDSNGNGNDPLIKYKTIDDLKTDKKVDKKTAKKVNKQAKSIDNKIKINAVGYENNPHSKIKAYKIIFFMNSNLNL